MTEIRTSCTEKQAEIRPKRDASVDALRCLLMFLIVLHHAACHGFWKADTDHWLMPILFTALIYWHVDAFLAISGWYGVRFSLQRYFSLFGVIAFWSLAKFVVLYLTKQPVPFEQCLSDGCWSGGWFGNTYLAFIFIAPILNAAMEALAKLERKQVLIIWGVFNAGMILNWAPCQLFSGVCAKGGEGFSILTFISVYLNVRLVKLLSLDKYFSRKTGVAGVALFVLGFLCFSVPVAIQSYLKKGFIEHLDWVGYTTYNSPHSIIMAIVVLLFFVKFVHLPRFISAIVEKIAPLMFGVYILQEGTFIGRDFFIIPETWLAGHTRLNMMFIVFVSAGFTFVVCAMLDALRRAMVAPLKSVIMPRLKRLDQKLGFSGGNKK